MILTYSNPGFKFQILHNLKIHTIRKDAGNRWKKGMKIQHWLHSPRNPSKNPHQFHESVCTGTESIVIICNNEYNKIQVFVEGKELTPFEFGALGLNDGLSSDEFRQWFAPKPFTKFSGKIIHWTEKRYA